jgi:hypothetical protein
MLPEGVLEDDGVVRGIIFVGAAAHLDRQFEFVKTEWVNKACSSAPDERDPGVGSERWAAASSPSPNGVGCANPAVMLLGCIRG